MKPNANPVVKKEIKKIVVIGKYRNVDITSFVQKVINYLTGMKYEVFVEEDTHALSGVNYQKADINERYDLALAIGGDGTMMGAARRWGMKGIPLLGINHGRIGFLTDIPNETVFEKLAEVLSGSYKTEQRQALDICVTNGKEVFYQDVAINDLVVGRGVSGKLMEFSVFVDEDFVYSQYCDGIIVATPTGSTAYSLAAGGSIIHPTAPVLNIVPVCPQNLSNRPLVVSVQKEIKIFFSGKESIYYSLDGIDPPHAQAGSYFHIKNHEQSITLIHPKDYNFFQSLRQKLNWVNN